MTVSNYQRLADILAGSEEKIKPDSSGHSKLWMTWRLVASEKIAIHTEHLELKGNTLTVRVSSSTWAHEIINRHHTLLSGLQRAEYPNLDNMSVSVQVATRKKPNRYQRPVQNPPKHPSAKLGKLFKKLAEQSVNPQVKAVFIRMSERQDSEC